MTIPGNLTKDEMLERMIRVDQAGEYGAKRIYAGQLAVLKNKASKETLDEIREMDAQEQVHLDYFNNCLLYTSPSPRDQRGSRMPSSA